MSFILTFAAAAIAQAAPAPMPAFLAGCWEHRQGERWTQECWTEPRAGQMMGSSRSGTGERLTGWEFMRIERGPDGAITFYGSPSGAPGHPFRTVQATDFAIEFADPAHDFPQRILYERNGDHLIAEVSLKDGSKPVRWSFVRRGRSKD